MEIQENVSLALRTTLRVGGEALYFIEVQQRDEIPAALSWARGRGIPWKILGGGSNVLVPDAGFDGLVIHIAIPGIACAQDAGAVSVSAGAGERWDDVVAAVVARGGVGMENLSAIPGSAGAAPVQNIGAYGAEFADFCVWVDAYDVQRGAFVRLAPDACAFQYRSSCFRREPECFIITGIGMRTKADAAVNIAYRDLSAYFEQTEAPPAHGVRDAVIAIRAGKFPRWQEGDTGTAGSFFGNPLLSREDAERIRARFPEAPIYTRDENELKIPAGWLIEQSGFVRGHRAGAVGLWKEHALVLVTHQGATAHAVDAYADAIAQNVKDTFGIELVREVVTLM